MNRSSCNICHVYVLSEICQWSFILVTKVHYTLKRKRTFSWTVKLPSELKPDFTLVVNKINFLAQYYSKRNDNYTAPTQPALLALNCTWQEANFARPSIDDAMLFSTSSIGQVDPQSLNILLINHKLNKDTYISCCLVKTWGKYLVPYIWNKHLSMKSAKVVVMATLKKPNDKLL